MLTLAPTVLAFVVLFAPMAVASDRAGKSDRTEKPPLRSTVPSRVETPKASPETTRVVVPARASSARNGAAAKVNVNTADVKSLMTLTGVGRKVAEKIVEYRESHGPFKKADELRKVEGVGNGVWERNRERIVVK